jgi:hypothetical protein
MAFIPCVYYEQETTEREDLSWYIHGKVLTLEDEGDGPEIAAQSRMLFLEDWDDEGHVLPQDVVPGGALSHDMRREALRQWLMTLLYTQPREP